uniref:Protein NLRC3-like n=1 Tax=Gouania willdenowi TaxID=441366 RepID=A0A8C5E5P5_GOUWI
FEVFGSVLNEPMRNSVLQKLSLQKQDAFRRNLWKRHSQPPPQHLDQVDQVDLVDLVDQLLVRYSLQESLQVTKGLLLELGQKKAVEHLHRLCLQNEVQHELRELLKQKYGEGWVVDGERRSCGQVLIDLHLSAGSDYGPNVEHEVLIINPLHTNQEEAQQQLSADTIFSPAHLQHSHTQLVLLTGVAGSGKSTLVRKLVLDWAEQRSHQHVNFLFPVTFRELRAMGDAQVSLLGLLQHLYPPTLRLTFDLLRSDDVMVMFVFDGLDEYDRKLDLFNTELYGAEPHPTSMDVLVVNLLRGRLLQGAQFLVTARSQVKHSVQLHGFCSAARDEYFRRRFGDREQCDRVLAHVRRLKTLHAMCHLPLFCSLLADECQRVFDARRTHCELPHALTHVHTRLLLALVRQRRSLRAAERSPLEERVFLMEVGRLAFSMLEDGSYLINTSTGQAWDSCSVNIEEAVDHSGVCTQFLIRPQVLHVEKVLSFIHPVVQEYTAALYAFLSFINHGTNVFEPKRTQKNPSRDLISFYSSAVDRSLQCSDGKLNIFLRFLFGLSVETNVELLQPLCSSPPPPSFINEAAALLRNKIKENKRRSNLQSCLEELRVSAHFTQQPHTP